MSEALYRKYRPSTFADVTNQGHVKTTIGNQIVSDSVAHAYLFTGPRGVGKTTLARLVAKAVNCENRTGFEPCNACSACNEILAGSALDVCEIDAASNTGVDSVRENIIESVRFAPSRLKRKVYIIDEVHMLSTSAFNALLKTLEEPPSYVIFILATTEIHKVPATIVSRCQRFDFRRIEDDELVTRMQGIVKAEGVKVDEDVLREVARHAHGGARDAESMLGQILALGEKNITMNEASLVLPSTTRVLVDKFIASLDTGDAAASVRLLNAFVDDGVDLPHFADDVVERVRETMIDHLSQGNTAAARTSAARIQALLAAKRGMKTDTVPQLPLELAILDICGVPQAAPPQPSAQNFKKLEVALSPPPVSVAPPAPSSPELVEGLEPSTITLHDLQRRWHEVYARLKETNASLPLVLQNTEIVAFENGEAHFTFKYSFHADTVNQDKNKKILEAIIFEVLGARVRIRGIHHPAEEAVAALLQEFGGSVI